MVSTVALHTSVRVLFPGLGLKEAKMFLFHPLVKLSIVGSLCDREVACSASDLQGLNFESYVWRAVSSHHPQDFLLAQFSLYPSKHETLTQCWFNVGPPSARLSQHWTNIGSMYRVCWVCAQKWPKARFISLLEHYLWFSYSLTFSLLVWVAHSSVEGGLTARHWESVS